METVAVKKQTLTINAHEQRPKEKYTNAAQIERGRERQINRCNVAIISFSNFFPPSLKKHIILSARLN